MREFTMDGYKDLDAIAHDVRTDYNHIDIPHAVIADVARRLLGRVKHFKSRKQQEVELLMGVSGIVACAIDEGLIDEEIETDADHHS